MAENGHFLPEFQLVIHAGRLSPPGVGVQGAQDVDADCAVEAGQLPDEPQVEQPVVIVGHEWSLGPRARTKRAIRLIGLWVIRPAYLLGLSVPFTERIELATMGTIVVVNTFGDDPLARIDPAAWAEPEMRAALRTRDIGTVYHLLKRCGVSQRRIATLTGQSQPEVSGIMRGRQVMAYDVLSRIADGLGVPRGLMGLAFEPSRITSVWTTSTAARW